MTSWTTPTTWPTDLLRVGDLTCISLAELLDLSARMKAEPCGWTQAMAGQSVACLLDGPSTRTRLSAEAAAHRLGMVAVAMHSEDLGLDRHEAIGDIGRRSVVWEQVANRLPTEQAVIYALATAARTPAAHQEAT
jgi:ornithine carbamoyltransferase